MIDSGFQQGDQSGGGGLSSTASASGFPSGADNEGLPRDMTLDSIASLPPDLTPSEAQELSEATTPSTSNNNTSKVVINDENIPEKPHTNAAAVKQGRLLRQVSEKLNQDVERERQLGEILQAIGMATLGTAIVVCSAVFIYRRLQK
jgi:hypothetical protein